MRVLVVGLLGTVGIGPSAAPIASRWDHHSVESSLVPPGFHSRQALPPPSISNLFDFENQAGATPSEKVHELLTFETAMHGTGCARTHVIATMR